MPHIAKAVGGRIPILIDGGIRRGSDVFKALALGANMVLIGRPIVWGLAVNGAEGVNDVISCIRKELEMTMKMVGTPKLTDIHREFLVHKNFLSHL